MPYALISDTHADDPIWELLSGGNRQRRESIKVGWVDAMTEASRHRTDGYLTREMADRCAGHRAWVVDALTTAVLGRAPRWHKPGDECACLGDGGWIAGFAYRIHKFLKRNPSRSENDRNRQQKADLRDARLKGLVYARDGGCCRYCRSGVLLAKAGRSKDRRKVLQYDHVDPDQPAGIDGANLVVACARCNEHKGHRTPAEADMVLLPEPDDADRAAWRARGLALFDLPDPADHSGFDHRPITDKPPTNHQHVSDPVTDPDADRVADPDPRLIDNTTAQPRPDHDDHAPEQARGGPGKGPGWVGDGHPLDTDPSPPSQLPRPPDAPDIYHRRSRASPTSTPAPDTSPHRRNP